MEFPRILFRTDGSASLGLGHVTRCIALSRMLESAFGNIQFVLKRPEATVSNLFLSEQLQMIDVNNEDEFIDLLDGKEIVVLDGYNFDTDIQEKIRATGSLLVCIDDLHNKHFIADLLINHAPGVEKKWYDAEKHTDYLLGTKYSLLRPNFLRQARMSRILPRLDCVLVCFGGSDSKNLTQEVLEVVVEVGRFSKIVVITGIAYAFTKQLDQYVDQQKGQIVHLHGVEEQVMIDSLLSVQLAIIPSSGILFEVVACKTPAISGYCVSNQLGIYHGFRSLNAFYDAEDFNVAALKNALHLALTTNPDKIMENQSGCIDGLSGERYIEAFKKLSARLVSPGRKPK